LKKSVLIELKILGETPDDRSLQTAIAETMVNLGGVYSKIGSKEITDSSTSKTFNAEHPKAPSLDSCIHYYKWALQFYTANKDEDGIAFSYNGLATAFRLKRDFGRCVVYTRSALEIFRKEQNEREMAQSFINFSDLYLDTKEYKKCLQYADSAEQFCYKSKLFENVMYTYETKLLAYEQLGDIKNQLKYYKKFTNLKDSLNNVNNTIAIEELKTQYETEKKEKAIVELKKDNEIKSLQTEKDAATKNRLIVIIITIVIVVLLLVWLAVFLQRIIKERKEAYIKLQEKNIEIQKQGELLSEQSKLISKYQSQMNPHFIFNALNSIQGFVVNDEKQKTIDQLQLFSTLMRQTLNNSNDEQINLDTEINYLKTYVQFEQSRFKEPLKFEVSLPEDSEDILVPPMMIQPFIENCIKHAGLHTIKNPSISLHIIKENELLKVVVKDNGVGFDTRNSEIFQRSHAVSMIRSRLSILFKANGRNFLNNYFEMRSKPDLAAGTEVIFYLPLHYKY
jgi:anti-sigma regulatory factor (Ser/Thr protein kinase)